MEVLSLASSRPLHEDAPMDLSTGSSRIRQNHHHHHHHLTNNPHMSFMMQGESWRPLSENSRSQVLSPSSRMHIDSKTPSPRPTTPSASRYIPIPKKRHCLSRVCTPTSVTSSCSPSLNFTSLAGWSPPSASDCTTYSSFPLESARKRARLEIPTTLTTTDVKGLTAKRISSYLPDSTNSTSVITSTKSSSLNSGFNDRLRLLGEELNRGIDEKVASSRNVSQSAMRQRPKHRSPSDTGSSSSASATESSVSGLRVGSNSGGMLGRDKDGGSSDDNNQTNAHLLSALMQLQAASQVPSEFLPSTGIKETDALMSAVRQSQLLYYSYCSQLIQNLRVKQYHQHPSQDIQPHPQPQQHHPLEETHLDYDSEDKSLSRHEDIQSKSSSEDFEDDVREDRLEDNGDDEDHLSGLNSILRMRLNTQESLDSQISPAPSPCGTNLSSTPGGDDLDFSPTDSSGRARKRAPRALTGKHVRPGTGASSNTLLTLRQKLQERQKYRETYGSDPPMSTKSKSKSKKR